MRSPTNAPTKHPYSPEPTRLLALFSRRPWSGPKTLSMHLPGGKQAATEREGGAQALQRNPGPRPRTTFARARAHTHTLNEKGWGVSLPALRLLIQTVAGWVLPYFRHFLPPAAAAAAAAASAASFAAASFSAALRACFSLMACASLSRTGQNQGTQTAWAGLDGMGLSIRWIDCRSEKSYKSSSPPFFCGGRKQDCSDVCSRPPTLIDAEQTCGDVDGCHRNATTNKTVRCTY